MTGQVSKLRLEYDKVRLGSSFFVIKLLKVN